MTHRSFFSFSLLAGLIFAGGCEYTAPNLRMLIDDHQQFAPKALQAIIEEQSGITLSQAEVPLDVTPLQALSNNNADLALIENSSAFVSGVRAVLPVYERVLHIALDDAYQPSDPQRPLLGADFYIANRSAAGSAFVDLVTRRQDLSTDQYKTSPVFEEGVTDFIIYFGAINPDNTTWMHPGFSLVSLDNDLNPQRKFYEESISYTAPNMKPKVIPALTYDLPGNKEALLTVAVDTLLVTRKEVSEATIYELTRTFIEQKPRFTAMAPHLFSGINESFDPLALSFPLHRGARAYLQRDDPSFIERYAETINLVVYITFLFISAFLAFTRWRDHRKKDRIDVFYERILKIRDEQTNRSAHERLAELRALEQEAFGSLMKEKLAANESFRIFTDLLSAARNDIRAQAAESAAPAEEHFVCPPDQSDDKVDG
ncbi:TAXI family TRAP transporter solute-binding subunit [Pseudohalioglobus lutimaris]|uniref:C4-dicarboxylate ABC transporter substrate-binding protein n=1 Tax=Pseudohalioglobus lutimaris TaxID=1737061 RepID=A0A2N5WX75_9GAMM|nr:TAXI family TRAP transporter solute-binding subunit [Pseudohalioglobus lutimaris]PLW66835.1 hypothetical protein C0039_19855 [Pseudohalioglobus lutimaris]